MSDDYTASPDDAPSGDLPNLLTAYDLIAVYSDGRFLTPDEGARMLVVIRDLKAALDIMARTVEANLAEQMTDKRLEVPGLGVIERHKRTDRKRWNNDDLLRLVLDTKVISEDGEILDPTPLDKVLDVWNLGAPRVTRLKARGIDPDQFCESTPGGWQLQLPARDVEGHSSDEAAA